MSTLQATFIIHYIDKSREKIAVHRIVTQDFLSTFDLASRRMFEYWEYSPEEQKNPDNVVQTEKTIESRAIEYAKALAVANGKLYVPYNNEDGILD